jgi:hypothetical protein
MVDALVAVGLAEPRYFDPPATPLHVQAAEAEAEHKRTGCPRANARHRMVKRMITARKRRQTAIAAEGHALVCAVVARFHEWRAGEVTAADVIDAAESYLEHAELHTAPGLEPECEGHVECEDWTGTFSELLFACRYATAVEAAIRHLSRGDDEIVHAAWSRLFGQPDDSATLGDRIRRAVGTSQRNRRKSNKKWNTIREMSSFIG